MINFHNNKNQFVSAIEYTAAETGFEPSLIEKDYFCSVILNYFSQHNNSLIFKGGTLLAKVHAGFYRLSEDLDFTLPIVSTATRKLRREAITPLKPIIHSIPQKISGFHITTDLKGSNESRHYNIELMYDSFLARKQGRILIEIGLREELILKSVNKKINTLLLNPFTQNESIAPFEFPCLAKNEAYAEKVRAALTRNRLAIRDFYDLDHAIKKKIIDFSDIKFLALVSQKIKNTQSFLIEFDDITIERLTNKINSELAPTLRQKDIINFDLMTTIQALKEVSKKLF